MARAIVLDSETITVLPEFLQYTIGTVCHDVITCNMLEIPDIEGQIELLDSFHRILQSFPELLQDQSVAAVIWTMLFEHDEKALLRLLMELSQYYESLNYFHVLMQDYHANLPDLSNEVI